MTTTPNTPTSGAADLPEALTVAVDCWFAKNTGLGGCSDKDVRELADIFRIHALAAGQATAAPAEPDPTPGDHPQPCDSELFESGVSVGLFDIPQWTAEALCKGIAAATGARVDWHYIGGRVHVKALPAPTSAEGAAYAELPDEREMLKHALWLASSFTVHRYLMSNAEGRWSGAEKATCHDELCRLYVAVFRGVEVDQVRVDLEADWMAVHDATQELTDHIDAVIGFPLKGVPAYEELAPKFFAYFHRLATHTLRAARGQAPAGATELAEADRRAGAAERKLAASKEDVARIERVRDKMKDQWGVDRRVSFDVVWAEALALKAGTKSDSGVQEDAACWHWLAEYLVGTRTDLDDEIVASETVNDLRKLVKAAIKQGEKQ